MKVYTVNSNEPGFLPENEGSYFLTFAAAKASLIQELLLEADLTDTEADAESFTHAAEDLNLFSDIGYVTAAGRAWFIGLADTDDETECGDYLDLDEVVPGQAVSLVSRETGVVVCTGSFACIIDTERPYLLVKDPDFRNARDFWVDSVIICTAA